MAAQRDLEESTTWRAIRRLEADQTQQVVADVLDVLQSVIFRL